MWKFTLLVLARIVAAGPESSPQAEQCKSCKIRDDSMLMTPDCKSSPVDLLKITVSVVPPQSHHLACTTHMRVMEKTARSWSRETHILRLKSYGFLGVIQHPRCAQEVEYVVPSDLSKSD
jgi:hypothetical protein